MSKKKTCDEPLALNLKQERHAIMARFYEETKIQLNMDHEQRICDFVIKERLRAHYWNRYEEAIQHLENLALGGLEIIDPRMSYCNLQVSPEDVTAARAFLKEEPQPAAAICAPPTAMSTGGTSAR